MGSSSDINPSPFDGYILANGVVDVHPGEFGWEIESYCDVGSKLSYLYTYAMRNADKSVDTQSDEIFTGNPELRVLRDAVVTHTGITPVFHKSSDKYHPFGYIDHQSLDVAAEPFNIGLSGVIQFLFSNSSSFDTDNDNH